MILRILQTRFHLSAVFRLYRLIGPQVAFTVEVEFIVNEEESRQLLTLLQREKLRIFYAHTPARFGVVDIGADIGADDLPVLRN